MRIADKMAFEQVKGNISKNRSQMSDLQNQAATQKRVTKPSDDPLAASRVLSNRIDLQGNKQFSKNLSYAKSFLEFTDQSLGELSEVIMRAKELALSQANDGSSNEESRRVVATEVEQLYNQMVAIGNRKLGDRFIFGGFHTQQSPFDDHGNYAGDDGEMMIHIDKESFLAMNIPGGRIFLGLDTTPDGLVKNGPPQAKTIEELMKREEEQAPGAALRGPASVPNPGQSRGQVLDPQVVAAEEPEVERGINLFNVLHAFGIALKTDDKAGVQDTLDILDGALNQVIITRARVGSRGMALDNYMQTMDKQKVENKISISALEDADVFSTVSDINKTQTTLQATLETSGKMIQPSLLQFLR